MALDKKLDNKQKIQKPSLYRVLLHNDNYTTMNFVVNLLMKIFGKSFEQATEIMENIHQQGQDTAGIYSYDIAISKIEMVQILAKEYQFPLKSSLEKI